MTAVTDFAAYINAAARQRRYMQPWLADRRFKVRGGTLLHAVDADIIKLYTSPEKLAIPTKQRREGYAKIFPNDKNNLSITVGRALAHHIFHVLSGTQYPLLVIPPTEQEIRRVYEAVASNAEREQNRAKSNLNQIRFTIERLKEQTDPQVLLKNLIRKSVDLEQFLTGEKGHSAELRRFSRLLADTRIAPPEFVIQQNWINDPGMRDALAPVTNFRKKLHLRKLHEAWFHRLRQKKSPAQSNLRVNDDAQALARIELINNDLKPEQQLLVLVTGDLSLHEAARAYIPSDKKYNFADLYLRHPRGYLAEHSVLSPEQVVRHEEDVETEFVEWLDTFLSEVQLGGKNDTERLDSLLAKGEDELEEMAEPVLKTHPDIIDELQGRWERYTENLTVWHRLNNPSVEVEQSIDENLAQDINGLLTKVSEQLENRVRETWDACFEAAMEAGYGLLFHKHTRSGQRPRNAPVMLFDSFHNTQEFVQKILASHKTGTMNAKVYDKIIEGLWTEDNSGYLYYLAYSFLFASEGSWHVAAILAARARDVVKSQSNRSCKITGREAAYLRAVALRHNIRRVRDLEQVALCLELAEQCFRQETHLRPLERRICEIRFESERLAIYITYHLFRLFLKQTIPESVPELSLVHQGLRELLLQFKSCEQKSWGICYVERSLLTNFFMTSLLLWNIEKKQEAVDLTELRQAFERFRENIETERASPIQVSFLVDAVFTAAGWWTAQDNNEKRFWRQKLNTILQDGEIEANSVMPYDEHRFRFLRKIAR